MSINRLDSDQHNADAQLEVKFYIFEGEGPWKGVPHVRIIAPGDKLNINDRVATDDDKRRFQRQWLFFQQDSTADQIVGTPLSVWRTERPEELSDGQLQELLILKFMSVEQIAMASDSQVQRVMGAAGLRERARSYLTSKNAQASGAELQNTKAELEVLKAQMAALLAAQQAAPPPIPTAPHISVHKRRALARAAKLAKGKKDNVQHNAPAAGSASL